MSTRSRCARIVAREVIRGLDESGPKGHIDPEEFRSWVRSIQGLWGRPRSWRKGRRQMPAKHRGIGPNPKWKRGW